MKKIIHMSDLHVGHEDLGDRFSRIIRNLIWEKGDSPGNYVIVITGDLVDSASQHHYDEVNMGLDILKSEGFKDVLVIPGNHDYGTGSRGDAKFVAMFKKTFFGGLVSYPKLDRIGDIAFIGLDSMEGELNWFDKFGAQGGLGARQLDALGKLLATKKVKSCKNRVIYLHHHPFDAYLLHQLKDSDALHRVIGKAQGNGVSIDAILYGHNHMGRTHNGHWGIIRCYDAGTATLKKRSTMMSLISGLEVKSSTRLIQLDKHPSMDYELELFY